MSNWWADAAAAGDWSSFLLPHCTTVTVVTHWNRPMLLLVERPLLWRYLNWSWPQTSCEEGPQSGSSTETEPCPVDHHCSVSSSHQLFSLLRFTTDPRMSSPNLTFLFHMWFTCLCAKCLLATEIQVNKCVFLNELCFFTQSCYSLWQRMGIY